jgi:N6-adenosine-specific RNA methylase IME4
MRRAQVLVADPPWKFNDQLPGPKRGADKHYPTLSIANICAFPLPPLADDCYLFLWRVSSMVEEAYQVCRAWGFKPKSELVWRKTTVNGKRWFGMGRSVRLEHEVAIIATRGRPQVRSHSVRSVFDAKAGRHSAKPEEFFDLVEEMCRGPYAEIFARRVRAGWQCYGNEVPRQTRRRA